MCFMFIGDYGCDKFDFGIVFVIFVGFWWLIFVVFVFVMGGNFVI